MRNMTIKLNNKLELWGDIPFKNVLGETDFKEGKIKDVWCNILPHHGSVKNVSNTEVEKVETTQIIKCRKLSVKAPKNNMFFKDKDGLKYEIIDFYPDFKNNDFWELKTKIVYE